MEDANRSEPSPLYELCYLLQSNATGPRGEKITINCLQALGSEIYIGYSNGALARFTLNETEDGALQYTPTSEMMLQTRSQVDDIQLAPSLSMALVLSDGQIFFLSLPTLALVSPDIIRPMKNAIAFALNETLGPQEPVGLAVIRRDGISFWELGTKLVRVKWKILPKIAVSQPGEFLVVACTGTSADFKEVYTMGIFVNDNGDPCQDPIAWEHPPESVAVDEDIVVSLHLVDISGKETSVVEIRKKGVQEIVQSIQLPPTADRARFLSLSRLGFSAPATSRLEKLRMTSMLLFDSLDASKKEETESYLPSNDSGLTPPPTPKPLSKNSSRSHERSRSRGRHDPSSLRRGHSLPTAHLLVATSQSVYALLPSNLMSQVESILDKGKVKEAAMFLAQAQAKHGKNDALAGDFQYLNLRIGIEYLHQTAFEDAGDALFRGGLDPRMLIGLWDSWRELARRLSYSQSASTEEPINIEVFSGLEKQLHIMKGLTIETIGRSNLLLCSSYFLNSIELCQSGNYHPSTSIIPHSSTLTNYSPHLKPSTTISSAGQELRASLHWNAKEMLKKYLRKFRTRRSFLQDDAIGMYSNEGVNRSVDTVLVILYAESNEAEDLNELLTLLNEPKYLKVEDIREVLISNGHIPSLVRLYERNNDFQPLIEIYVQLVEDQLVDSSIPDPLERLKRLLPSITNRDIVQKYALWLLRRDRTSAIELMIMNDARHPRGTPEDILLLSKIQEVDSDASLLFLEYLVLQKQSPESSFHSQLVLRYLDALLASLQDPKTFERQKEITEQYRVMQSKPSMTTEAPSTPSFLWYLAFDTPGSALKRTRLKLDFMLQGSPKYDMDAVRRRIRIAGRGLDKILALEMAILEAKYGNHKSTLFILVNDLQDFLTAEAYCALGGGRVITPKLAVAIGDRLDLSNWAAQVLALEKDSGQPSRWQGSGTNTPNMVDVDTPNGIHRSTELTRMLLEVYMGVGQAKAKEASMLLNAQGNKLDPEEIIPLMPGSWSLDLVSSFLERSFRRSSHASYEGQILKQLSAAQNLQTSELAFEVFAAAGAMIEESNDEDSPTAEDSPPPPPPKIGEKEQFDGGREIPSTEKPKAINNESDVQPSTSFGAKKEWNSVLQPEEHSISLDE
ncbi:hypothetical protein FRC17_002878 [Serendipita sp. 399]|nr:hypothetical protein FRC17_002878 [Serendipita sp. 399]